MILVHLLGSESFKYYYGLLNKRLIFSRLLVYVRPARTCSNGCKSLNRPDSGKVTAKDKGKESHTILFRKNVLSGTRGP